MLNKLFLVIFTGIPAIFFCVGAGMAYWQQRMVTTYLPVPAKVESAEVAVITSHSRKSGTTYTYKPAIYYNYTVAGTSYGSGHVTPMDESASRKWAQGIVDRFPPEAACEAYYDPANPAESFLVRQVSFFPHIFMLFPMLFFAIAACLAFGTGMLRGRAVPAPRPRPGGWLEIFPVWSISRRIRLWGAIALVWYGAGALIVGHYVRYSWPEIETAAVVASGIYTALGLGFLGTAVYFYRLHRHVDDARVLIDTALLVPGGQVTVQVTQIIHSPQRIEELKVGLICEAEDEHSNGRKTTYSTQTCHATWATLLQNQTTRLGQAISEKHVFTIPTGVNSSSPQTFKGYPFYSWKLRVENRLAGSPDYRGDFTLLVTADDTVSAGAPA